MKFIFFLSSLFASQAFADTYSLLGMGIYRTDIQVVSSSIQYVGDPDQLDSWTKISIPVANNDKTHTLISCKGAVVHDVLITDDQEKISKFLETVNDIEDSTYLLTPVYDAGYPDRNKCLFLIEALKNIGDQQVNAIIRIEEQRKSIQALYND